MGGGSDGGRIERESVRGLTRITLLAAALIFLVTIALGFMNAIMAGEIPRWQVLTHLHSGTVGWILLSFIGVAIWLFAGEQGVSAHTSRRLKWLVGLAILAFAGLVGSFGYGFSQGGTAMTPLGVFAPFAAVIVWAAALYALFQLRTEVVATTARLLVAVGLLLAAIGATFGAWVGLNHAFSQMVPTPPEQAIGAHALTVLPAVAVISVGVLEWLVLGEDTGSTSKVGAAQVGIGAVMGLFFPVAFFLILAGVSEEALQPIFIGLLVAAILFTLLYLGRVGWRALRTNPVESGTAPWAFFGTIWAIVFLPSVVLSPMLGDPEWLGVLSIHAFFVGFVTNAILGGYSARTKATPTRYAWAEPAAVWLTNLGIVVFVAVEATLQTGHGAMVMGVGLLLGVATMGLRLQSERAETTTEDSTKEIIP